MGLIKNLNFVAVGTSLLLSIVMTACGGGSGGGSNSGTTVANVPANYCSQTGVNGVNGTYPAGYNGAYNGGYNGAYQNGQFGYGNPAPYGQLGVQQYGYNGSGCAVGTVPACYPNGGGMACIPQQTLYSFGQQGYNPTILSYNQGLNSYGYGGYLGYTNNGFAFNGAGVYGQPGYYGYQGTQGYGGGYPYGRRFGRGGMRGGMNFGGINFQFGVGSGGGYSSNVIQGCNAAAGPGGCSFGTCRPMNNGSSLGICTN